jgi:hypothetical protein
VLGLLADLPRKNCWTIAEHVGDGGPDGMQHLLRCWVSSVKEAGGACRLWVGFTPTGGSPPTDLNPHTADSREAHTDGVRGDLRDYVVEHLGDPAAAPGWPRQAVSKAANNASALTRPSCGQANAAIGAC